MPTPITPRSVEELCELSRWAYWVSSGLLALMILFEAGPRTITVWGIIWWTWVCVLGWCRMYGFYRHLQHRRQIRDLEFLANHHDDS